MRADSLMECCLGEVIHSIKDVVVFEVVVGVVDSCLGGVIGCSYICAADSLRIDVGDSGRGDGGSTVMGGGKACVRSEAIGEKDYCRIAWVI